MKIFLFAFHLLILTSCNRDVSTSPSDGNTDKSYPTTLIKLNQFELDSLKVILNQKLGTKYLAQIDSFGLLGHYHGGVAKPRGSTITNPAQAISIAKSAILDLSQFTNVFDTSALVMRSAKINGVTYDWDIIFANQFYKGLEVWNTRIDAIVADQFILLYQQHHYKNINIPQQNVISKEVAKSKLVGTEIKYQCWLPSSYVIADSSINLETIEQCIYPLLKMNSIELHVVWKIPISLSSFIGWYYFMDVLTGEIIASEQLFMCAAN
jgi:hypothetical protein